MACIAYMWLMLPRCQNNVPKKMQKPNMDAKRTRL